MSDNFPVVDITHKPKRMQGDAIRRGSIDSVATFHSNHSEDDVLEVVTLERAIRYYEDLAGKNLPNSKLYSATAKWLKELFVSRSPKTMLEVHMKNSEDSSK